MMILMVMLALLPSSNDMEIEGRSITKTLVVAADLDTVWQRWTTEAGARTFFAPAPEIELKPGGAYNMIWFPEAPKGQRGAEDLTIIEFRAPSMLSFTWSATPQHHYLRNNHLMRVTILLEAVDEISTKVTLIHDRIGTGVVEGESWDEVLSYFTNAWNVVLGRLVYSLEHQPVDWENGGVYKETIDMSRITDRSTK